MLDGAHPTLDGRLSTIWVCAVASLPDERGSESEIRMAGFAPKDGAAEPLLGPLRPDEEPLLILRDTAAIAYG